MWSSSFLFVAIAWLIAVNAQKYDPGDKYPKPGRPLAHITERHNTCGQEGMAGDYSGYISIAIESKPKEKIQTGKQVPIKEHANMFFWFFEARHKPQDAPVILFLNGGPGISSIYRVFDGSGPCNIDWQGNIGPNPHSLNEYAHILYVDQPVGAGFSFGNANFTDNLKAAEYLYQFMQHFYFEFPQYRKNEFGIWTSDWGDTAGLALAERILKKNVGLTWMSVGLEGELPIRLSMMGLESPKIDPPSQLAHMYMYVAKNPWLYVQSIEDGEDALREYMDTLEADLVACSERRKQDCKEELKGYRQALRSSTTPDGLRTEFDLWDLRDARHNSDRSRNIGMRITPAAKWLSNAKTQAHLGVTGGKLAREPIRFEPWNIQVLKSYSANQEIIRSWRKSLRYVVHSKIRTMIVGGDADVIANPLGLRWLSQNVTVGINRTFEVEPLVWDSQSFNPERQNRKLTNPRR
ncbi:hypothetical protein NCS57_00645900 [Fusarium keratoplasticum]|uniref:Uncharacterized protein n=1 Tax=Fusarium keratoplasticum TaxID=1328300 RepID=A0ACC0R1H5_9HYPO|nr:hypothetical protein NCS57_00645900 [Fusarium keratoplasticum]KAI8671700.1 hypothetical protein NCS57_00645900 [Fusarium keratoplasticum]